MKRYLAWPIAATIVASAANSAASTALASSTELRPMSAYGSVNTRSSVMRHSSGFIATTMAALWSSGSRGTRAMC